MIVQVFLISGLISFFGTIPPATINVTVLQLALKNRAKQAVALAIGAAIIDSFYAGLSVNIAAYLEQHLAFSNSFFLIAALALLVLGTISLSGKFKPEVKALEKQSKIGLGQGLLLGLFNPLAMPFWLGWISVLQMNGWIDVEGYNYWGFILGAFVGEVSLLMIVVRVGERFTKIAENRLLVNIIPGAVLVILGIVNLINWFSFYW
ncbi:MAG: LysE family transporter [Cytophagales bacterium]|nr:LysE family transporter [Cytophagales bacterium]